MSKRKEEEEDVAATQPSTAEASAQSPVSEELVNASPNPAANSWQQEEQYFHYDFDGDMHISREVFKKIPIEDVANIIKAVFAKVSAENGLKTDTLYFKNGRLRVVVKDSNSREEIYGSDLSRSGQWHRHNKHHTVITVEELS